MNTPTSRGLPIGEPITDANPSPIPPKKIYTGKFVKLHPVEPEDDVDELYLNSHGNNAKDRIWTYMAYGPFSKKNEMIDWLKGCQTSTNMSFFIKNRTGIPPGLP